MSGKNDIHEGIRILSPVTGNAIPLDQVPDPEKVAGLGAWKA